MRMTDAQKDRFDDFKKSTVGKPELVAECVSKCIGSERTLPKTDPRVIIVHSCAKAFAGELLERARLLAHADGDDGPIKPSYLRRAHLDMVEEGHVQSREMKQRRLFNR